MKLLPPSPISSDSFSPALDYFNNPKFGVEFSGSVLNVDTVSYAPNRVVNFYFVFEIKLWLFYTDNSFTLRNFLLGVFKFKKILILISILIMDIIFHLV